MLEMLHTFGLHGAVEGAHLMADIEKRYHKGRQFLAANGRQIGAKLRITRPKPKPIRL